MSSSDKDDPFAYESSVHCSNVLLRLNSQRTQGVLCDVTVVVEDQRFQAHRAVLAACSDYFLSRVVQACSADLVITLPEEVTVKGFLPLLQFAYTSKLLVHRDDLLEIRKVAKLLEIHDVEETCFEFLHLKFQDNKAEQSDFSRKKWCKSFCPKAAGQQNDLGKPPVHEVEDLWKGEFSPKLKCPVETETVPPSPESPKQPCETLCFGEDGASTFSSLCPKYRKFQKAYKSDRVRSASTCSSNPDTQSPSPAPSNDASESLSQSKPQMEEVPPAKSDMEVTSVSPQGTDLIYPNFNCFSKVAMAAAYPPCFPLGPHDFSSVPFQCVYPPYRSLSYSDIPSDSSAAGLPEGSNSRQSSMQAAEPPNPEVVAEPQVSALGKPPSLVRERSNVEREVAEHLAKGFWPDLYPADFPCRQELSMATSKEPPQESSVEKRTECPWLGISISNEAPERTFTTLNPVSCPFINNLSNDVRTSSPGQSSEDNALGTAQDNCPYTCPINLDDDTDSDSEEDSAESSSAKDLECERSLPFNADKIISLSRYDFQSLVKMHSLSPGQLDCIHDIRRRSKNRIAAQRCRKRKLDCLQNLECEIQKLQDEKLNLLKERDKILSKLGETKQNLSGLCRQIWQDSSLTQEHLHMLAKFSSDKCLLSLVTPEKGTRLPHCESILPESTRGSYNNGEAPRHRHTQGGNACPRPILPPVSSSPAAAPAATADSCQPMTPKGTTDEQP
ncbi:transcription regulator protein BACH1 [Gastrophryne carolinensis]